MADRRHRREGWSSASERLTGELERDRRSTATRRPRAAEELVGAVIELYGEGLERIFAVVERRATRELRERLAGDGVVASLMLIHGLYPVALEQRVPRRSTACGPTWSRTAATSSCSGSRTGVARIRLEGSCDGCPASASTLELAIKSGARRGRARPRGAGGRGRGRGAPPATRAGSARAPGGPGRAARAAERPAVVVRPRRRRRALGEGELTPARGRRASTWSSRASRATCSPSATSAPAAARRSPAARSARARSPAPRASGASSCRARALARRRPAAARAGAAARRRRRREGRGCAPRRAAMSEALDAKVAARRQAELVAGLRRLPAGQRHASRRHRRRAAAAARSSATSAASRSTATTATSCTWSTGASSAPARAASRCAAAIAELRPTGTRTVWLDDFELPDEIWASFGIPIGLAFFIDSSATGSVGAALPEPGGRDRVRARARRLARAADARTRC